MKFLLTCCLVLLFTLTVEANTTTSVKFLSVDSIPKEQFLEQTGIVSNYICPNDCSFKNIFVYRFKKGVDKIWLWTADYHTASVYNSKNSTNKYTVSYDTNNQIIHITDNTGDYLYKQQPIANDVDWDNVYKRTQESIDNNE